MVKRFKGVVEEFRKLKFPKMKEVMSNSVRVSGLALTMIGIYFVSDSIILWIKTLF